MSDFFASGSKLGRSGRKPSARNDRRQCSAKGCISKLSMYNKDSSYCYQHKPVKFPRVRGHNIATDEE